MTFEPLPLRGYREDAYANDVQYVAYLRDSETCRQIFERLRIEVIGMRCDEALASADAADERIQARRMPALPHWQGSIHSFRLNLGVNDADIVTVARSDAELYYGLSRYQWSVAADLD